MEDAGVLLFFRDCNVCVVDDKNEEKKGENEQKRKDNEKRVNRSTYPRTHVRLPLENEATQDDEEKYKIKKKKPSKNKWSVNNVAWSFFCGLGKRKKKINK